MIGIMKPLKNGRLWCRVQILERESWTKVNIYKNQ